jgi:hypothetical protein
MSNVELKIKYKEKFYTNEFEGLHSDLISIRDKLVQANRESGLLDKVYSTKQEIIELGWNGIVDKYHPDTNIDEVASKELFAMYKFVYETMIKNKEI